MSLTLFFDGDCAFCSRMAWFIDRRDRKRTLVFETLNGDAGRALRAERPELASVDSLILVERDTNGRLTRMHVHSDAALAVARYLGGGWRVLGIGLRAIPRFVRDPIYRLVARHRAKL